MTPSCALHNITTHGDNHAKNITKTPTRDWDPNMDETRPLNQEDNQAPQPTISHLEIDHNNSTTTAPTRLCSKFWTGKFLIFTIMLEGQLKLRRNSISPWLLSSLTCLQDFG
jgi:hypothetical protein